MRQLTRWLCGALSGLAVCGAAWATTAEIAAKQAQVVRERVELRARIEALQKEIDEREARRKEASDALQVSEAAISVTTRRLSELATQLRQAQADLDELQIQFKRQFGILVMRRDELSNQLRKQYSSGLSPWTALLSGDDPQQIGRDLTYLDYISRARSAAVTAVKQEIDRLAELEAKTELRRQDVVRLVQETTEQKTLLEAQKKERATVLARIEGQLQAQRVEAATLGRDDKRLSDLVDDLAGQLQAARQAAENARKAEAARQAEQARQEEQARRQAQEENQVKEANQAKERKEAQARAAAAAAARASESQVESGAVGAGLKPGLRWPVKGQVMARFGTDRPEGGVWRGVLLRATEGASVQVVASGTVIYANWLRGFGNLIIIDHGQQYLTVYAYNQSLLKQVGDTVKTGETIALAGSTGGQVDSALYFEVRHRGSAVDPVQLLAR
ncbi:MAG: peptidoglycan DD-metalloendopeptidase family protein [Burkholderiaceae bacterium]|nr:peptidoglycan DD-metalloendopeptidase family protein [Burkholderiaceae bacterium]